MFAVWNIYVLRRKLNLLKLSPQITVCLGVRRSSENVWNYVLNV